MAPQCTFGEKKREKKDLFMILPCTFGERKDKTHLWFPRERLVKEKTHLWFPSVRLVKEKKILIDGSPVHVW